MTGRVIAAGVLLIVLALAGLEVRVLWPLAGASHEEFELTPLGEAAVVTEGKAVQIAGLAATEGGVLWAVDHGGGDHRILALDRLGNVLEEFPGTSAPSISTDGEGALFVDPEVRQVRRVERGAGTTRTWSLEPFALFVPGGVARVDVDTYAVAVTGGGLVFLYNDAGENIGRLGLDEDGSSQLLEPLHPIAEAQGRLYVSDRKGRVLRWTGPAQDATYRTREQEAGVLSEPEQFAIDGQGRMWVADPVARRVWVFDVESTELLGSWTPEAVPMPTSLAIYEDRIYLGSGAAIFWFALPP